MSTRFRVVLSAACALLGVMSCLAYASSVRDEAQRVRSDVLERFGGELTQLVVADQTIEAGEVITERNVRVRDWVSDLAPVDAVMSLDEVLGKEVRVPVAKGVPITSLAFREESEVSEVPSGRVAVSVPVTDKLGLSRGVTRGAKVSAYAVSSDGPYLLAADIEVLSELAASTGMAATQQITIAVLPENVADVLGASASGELRLVIPANDVETPEPAQEAEAPAEVVPEEGGE